MAELISGRATGEGTATYRQRMAERTALVGMRRVAHVEENARVAQVPPVPAETLRGLFR